MKKYIFVKGAYKNGVIGWGELGVSVLMTIDDFNLEMGGGSKDMVTSSK